MNDIIPLISKYMGYDVYILVERKQRTAVPFRRQPFENVYRYKFFSNRNTLDKYMLNHLIMLYDSYFGNDLYNVNMNDFLYKNKELLYEILAVMFMNIDIMSHDYVDLSLYDFYDYENMTITEIRNNYIARYKQTNVYRYLLNKQNKTYAEKLFFSVLTHDKMDDININKLKDIINPHNITYIYDNVIRHKLYNGNRCCINGHDFYVRILKHDEEGFSSFESQTWND